ncbi:MAG: hypothetical protein SPH17_03270 [Faecalicoccus sp.]|uniref:hypothetical protein n=1 Tax=Faecalicoccus sp. TaxID=1971758 RepID=UPI002A90950B|nr:hypothetical protein [Faecalicoccus sp.]MDY5232613.1 hypothetical protein [Faecalicoccus sp.]
MERLPSFNDMFDILFDQFNLGQEVKRVFIWLDMKEIRDDIVLFSPGLSIPFERANFAASKDTKKDRYLNLISRFDEQKEIFSDIQDAVAKLSDVNKLILDDYYTKGMNVERLRRTYHNPFAWEDLITNIALADPDYLLKDDLQNMYEQLKVKHHQIFDILKQEVCKDFDSKLLKYGDRFDLKWMKQNHQSGYYQSKVKIFIWGILYMDGKVTIEDLERFLPLLKGGRKLLKQL